MIWLIDDHHLSTVLRGRPLPDPVSPTDTLATTGYWYVRLCQAVLGAIDRPGALSGPFLELPDEEQQRAIDALLELPDDIELASLRDLGPTIGRLRQHHQLNVLSNEALAAAIHLDASVLLSTPSPKLQASLTTESRPHVVT